MWLLLVNVTRFYIASAACPCPATATATADYARKSKALASDERMTGLALTRSLLAPQLTIKR
jgi:hypothetical protein